MSRFTSFAENCDPQVLNHQKFPLWATTGPVRFLQEALVIFVIKQMSQFRSFGKWVKMLCLLDPTFARGSKGNSWEELEVARCSGTLSSTNPCLNSCSHPAHLATHHSQIPRRHFSLGFPFSVDIALVVQSLLEICPQISQRGDFADEEFWLLFCSAMDLCFLGCSLDAAQLSWIVLVELVPRFLCPSEKSSKIPAARRPVMHSSTVAHLSLLQLHFCHHPFFCFLFGCSSTFQCGNEHSAPNLHPDLFFYRLGIREDGSPSSQTDSCLWSSIFSTHFNLFGVCGSEVGAVFGVGLHVHHHRARNSIGLLSNTLFVLSTDSTTPFPSFYTT